MAAYLDSSYPDKKKKEERKEGFEEGFLRSSNSLTTVNEEIEKEINAFRSLTTIHAIGNAPRFPDNYPLIGTNAIRLRQLVASRDILFN